MKLYLKPNFVRASITGGVLIWKLAEFWEHSVRQHRNSDRRLL
jgi:hypothetical protein